jgi:hypothetical protein
MVYTHVEQHNTVLVPDVTETGLMRPLYHNYSWHRITVVSETGLMWPLYHSSLWHRIIVVGETGLM